MVINNKLVHFEKKTDFEEQRDAGNIQDFSIVFVKDRNEIYTHGEQYQWVEWSVLKLPILEGSLLTKDGESLVDSNGTVLIIN